MKTPVLNVRSGRVVVDPLTWIVDVAPFVGDGVV